MRIDQSLIGFELESYEVKVEAGDIKKFAVALGDNNPIYHDESAAHSKGYDSIAAPFTFPTTFRSEKQEDWFIGIDRKRMLHGELEIKYNKRITAGQTITCVEKVKDVYTKTGSGADLTFIVWVKEGYDEKKELLFVEKATTIIKEEQSNDQDGKNQ